MHLRRCFAFLEAPRHADAYDMPLLDAATPMRLLLLFITLPPLPFMPLLRHAAHAPLFFSRHAMLAVMLHAMPCHADLLRFSR